MDRRLLLFVAVLSAAVLLVAAAVPAIGRDSVAPTLDRKGSAVALAKAKRAFDLARTAKRKAREASEGASAAKDAAATAEGVATLARAAATAASGVANAAASDATASRAAAAAAQAQLDATRIVSAFEPAAVASNVPIGEYEAKGGPAVQVTVPSSGLIEVWAQVEIVADEGGAVALFEDGQKVPGISEPEFCGDDSALIDMQGAGAGGFMTFSTPPTPGLLGCANGGAPAPVLLSRPPGPHAYELRYSECSCPGAGEAEFRNRVLRVAPRP
ncbi:MAG: hypothetical protein WA862_04610 [Solirubrobacterales bacterium]